MEKIKKFLKRNERRNKHLWDNNKKTGIDYIKCPVTKTRLSMIKKNYIENILNMSVVDFDKKYPNIQKICSKRINNIKNGIRKIDKVTGLTKHQLSVKKSRQTLTNICDDGITGDQRRAIKTRQSNLDNIIDGKNGYQRTAEKARPKQIKTMMKQGKIANCKYRKEWEMYKTFVFYLTRINQQKIDSSNIVIGLKKGTYQLDHKYSITSGYNNKISPFVISNLKNLEYLKTEDNRKKGVKCSISINKLIKEIGIKLDTNNLEYNISMDIIHNFIDKNKPYSNLNIKEEIAKKINESNYSKK